VNKSKFILIVGGDSLIGSELMNQNKFPNWHVIGTTRRKEITSKNRIYLDLETFNSLETDIIYDVAIICAGITSKTTCEQDPKRCKLINVDNTLKLIDTLYKIGTHIIFLSTNAVFDGYKQYSTVYDLPSPKSFYGKYKLLVEKHILTYMPAKSAVLRLTKVISNDTLFLKNWDNNISHGKLIEAYTDVYLSPINLVTVIETLLYFINKKPYGLYHLGGAKELSYYQYALILYPQLLNELSMIKGVTVKNSDLNLQVYNSLQTFLPEDLLYYNHDTD